MPRTHAVTHRHAELGREHDPVPTPAERVAEQPLALTRPAVPVGGVEERDAYIEGGVDYRLRFGLVDPTAEADAAEADNAHLERPALTYAHTTTVSMCARRPGKGWIRLSLAVSDARPRAERLESALAGPQS